MSLLQTWMASSLEALVSVAGGEESMPTLTRMDDDEDDSLGDIDAMTMEGDGEEAEMVEVDGEEEIVDDDDVIVDGIVIREDDPELELHLAEAQGSSSLSPQPTQFAVLFDPAARTFSVVPREDLDGAGEGECISSGSALVTVIHFAEDADAAHAEARRRAELMNDTVMKGADVLMLNGNGLDESDEVDDIDEDDLSMVDEGQIGVGVANRTRYDEEDDSRPVDYENQDSIRILMEIMFDELNQDIVRINSRQERMRDLMEALLGGRAARGVLQSFARPRRLLPDLASAPPINRVSGEKNLLRSGGALWRPRRPAHPLSDDEDDWENGGEDGSDNGGVKKFGIGTPARVQYEALASYPYVTQETEMACIAKANGSSSEYARRLAKCLFADSLSLYFKDQDVKMRQWIHHAVDSRFPSDNRQAQATKWKNCSSAINKNRISEEPESVVSKDIDYSYVTQEDEEYAFANCHQDPTKYAELLGMKLFEGTLDRMFRDQDAVKKEWLRECVDIRFPLVDKLKRDGRWKVCASAVNRNRNKAVDVTGSAVAYPYISQELEERCFGVAKDNVALYAELLGRLMFKPTRHLMFKDQDPKMRQWVHDIIDRRYPTPDKARHAAKWKACSSAINKARFTADYPMPWEHGKSTPGHLSSSYSSWTPTADIKPDLSRLFKEELMHTPSTPIASSSHHHVTPASASHRSASIISHEEKPILMNAPQPSTAAAAPSSASAAGIVTSSGRSTRRSLAAREAAQALEEEKNQKAESSKRVVNGAKRERTHPIPGVAEASQPAPSSSKATPIVAPKRSRKMITERTGLPYPYLAEDLEMAAFEMADGNVTSYAAEMARILFKDTPNLAHKDQDPKRRDWLRMVVDHRFPSLDKFDNLHKWKLCSAAINKKK